MTLLHPANYRAMPWANGKGNTTEILREDGPDGMRVRLSIAVVVEEGPFSQFPGIDRILTVIEGPGFGLVGSGMSLRAEPLVPVAFPGDRPIAATRVSGRAVDFNVMTARNLGPAKVTVLAAGGAMQVTAPRLALFALGQSVCETDGATTTLPDRATLIVRGASEVRAAGPGTLLAVSLPV